jgi:predicted dienelactone hydrolase
VNIGARVIPLEDPVQHARVPLQALYPTRAPAAAETIGPYAVELARDAAPAGDPMPLVLVSHGNGASPWVHRDLALHLAREGFAVAMVEHPGNSRSDNSLSGTVANLENRPRHLALAIDAVLADPVIGPRIAPRGPRSIGAIGQSIGAYSVLALAGGTPSAAPHETPDRKPRRLEVAHDDRVGALVLLTPAAFWFAAPGALAAVDVPILLRAGGSDDVTPPQVHAELIRRGVQDPGKVDASVVANAGHFSFHSPFPPAMVRPDFPAAHDPPGFDRAAYQPVLARTVTAFLRANLR